MEAVVYTRTSERKLKVKESDVKGPTHGGEFGE